ncbi:MAG: cohesin domain-containing protein [Candidatus Poribacteria bacterium]
MKHIIITMVIILLFLSSFAYTASVSIDLRMVKQNLNVGDNLPVEVVIDKVTDLKGINLLVSFDSTKLRYVSISKNAVIEKFTEDIIPNVNEANANGKFEYLAVLEGPGSGIDISGGAILTINFSIKAPGNAWVKLLSNEISIADSTANAIPANIDPNQLITNIGQVFELTVFNYPNPVDISGKTTIRCASKAILDGLEARIYDISGELVKKVEYNDFNSSQAPIYEYEWNCKNEKDQDVANGVYILWVKAKLGSDEKNQTWKIAVLR